MTIDLWWPNLSPKAREWLTANNGDVVPAPLMAEIESAGGPAPSNPWWSTEEGTTDRCMPDDAVDWIEEAANAEEPVE